MLDSMFHSMTTSMQLAKDCLGQEQTETEQVADSATPFEGLEMFALTIEAGSSIPPLYIPSAHYYELPFSESLVLFWLIEAVWCIYASAN